MKLKSKERDIIQCLRKIFLVMRITLLLIFFSSALAFSSNSYAQNTKLTLHLSDAKMSEVLKAIEEKSEFLFFYQDQQIDLNRRVNVAAEDKNINEVLDQIFEGSSNVYAIRDRQIVIGKSQKQLKSKELSVERIFEDTLQPQSRKLTGTVYDDDGKPVPFATIVIKGTTKGTNATEDGAFSINVEPNSILVV